MAHFRQKAIADQQQQQKRQLPQGIHAFSGYVLLFCVLISITSLSQAKGTNIVLLMDSSGSMKTTDPDDLRKPAAKLLVSLLGADDRASIISFSDQGYPVTSLVDTANDSGKEQLFSAIDKVSSRGFFTNLYGAIESAEGILKQDPDLNRRKLIVLMSDGKMDLGDEKQSFIQTEKLFAELIPKIKAANIELQTIAFTEQSDKALLAEIARETGGRFYVAESDKDLHNSFTRIFEDTAQPNMLPVEGGHFQVDDSIKEITIIGSKNSLDVDLILKSPSGKNYSAANKPDNFKWQTTPLFDMITITSPEPGAWDLMASGDENSAYIITNLELKLSIRPNNPGANEQIEIQAWLEQDGEVLTRSSIIDNLMVTGRVNFPDGRSATLPIQTEVTTDGSFAATGIFSGQLVLPTQGQYAISLIANAGTFERKRSISFNAEDPSKINPENAPQTTPQSEAEPALEPAIEPTTEPVAEQATESTETPENTVENKIDGTLLIAIYIFIAANIVLALIFGATILRRKRKNA